MQQMIGKMARMFGMLIMVGFIIVLIAFVIGYNNSQVTADYFSATKEVRETTLLAERAQIESTALWLPYFKFLGIGLILGGIVMALRVIIDNLKGAGMKVMANLPEAKRPPTPAPPWYGLSMPGVMMLGEVIFILALVFALGNAGVARDLFGNNTIPAIDAAGKGSALLAQLQGIHASDAWLIPFKFFGVATVFLAIAMGLATITNILGHQTEMIKRGIEIGRSG